MTTELLIRPYQPQDQTRVIALWQDCGLTRPWNDPLKDIERKLAEQPELLLVGEVDGRIVASAMVGYDGHRGWVNYLSVDPALQGRGFGAALMRHIEALLQARGCPKLNLQVRQGNDAVLGFYARLGYSNDQVIGLGKRLIHDTPPRPGMIDASGLRLFTALWPEPATRNALQAWADALPWPASARRVRPADLHITLHFLGEVPAEVLPDLRQALALPSPATALQLDRAAMFHGGALVLEPASVPEALVALQAELDARLRALGLPLETRRWRPHVTLARHARGLAGSALSAPVPWHSQGHVLVASRPGSAYELLQRFGQ